MFRNEAPCMNFTVSGWPHAVGIQYHVVWEPAGHTSAHTRQLNKKWMVQVQRS